MSHKGRYHQTLKDLNKDGRVGSSTKNQTVIWIMETILGDYIVIGATIGIHSPIPY